MRKLLLTLIMTTVVGLSAISFSFASDGMLNDVESIISYPSDVEFTLSVDENGNLTSSMDMEAKDDETLSVSEISTFEDGSAQPLATGVQAFVKKNYWKKTDLELGIGCKATKKLKTYKGTVTVYNAKGMTKVDGRNFSMTNNAGSKNHVRQYRFDTGLAHTIKVKITNQKVIDLYGRSASLPSFSSPTWKQ